ncbi:conserved oligomeric Golgi complex subunit 1 isoform X2 [Parasteatoda tepidariorum]|uniref:conserved oligomeric Golgi complex subunit 1 isoform X2 n=1 Tax=Parasteatoda tepidariorum TaxID=114398 RepID=UPI0039BD5180
MKMTSVGTDGLFENHTVKEIQEIEKKLRNDIERKKEELRQMVGERYRDLMEAADTITEMKLIAENVTTNVKSIENRCTQLQNSSLQNGILFGIQDKVFERKKSKEFLYTLASQIKILMDSPTKIWNSIESKNFIDSVCLYLLARHIHSLLILSPDYCSQFPLINRQWSSIAQFRTVLLQNSQKVLESQEAEPEDVLGPICCLCLLTNSSLQHIFLEFLNTRQNVLKNLFQVEKTARDQVCQFVNVVQMTLKIIYVLFYPSNENVSNNGLERNLLYNSLTKLISSKEPGPVSMLDLKSSAIYKFLPSSITDFRPILTTSLEQCGIEFLQSKCSSWLQEIKVNLQSDLGTLLNYVKSVKSLSLIREALFENLCEIEEWDMICSALLNKSFSIWDFFLKDCFLKSIEDIISESVLNAGENSQRNIEKTLTEIGCETTSSKSNISLYVWSESPQDIIANIAWHSRHHRNYWDSGQLSMKSMGFTPKVQSICKDLDNQIKMSIEDISCFSSLKVDSSNQEKFMTEIHEESNVINRCIAQTVENGFHNLICFIEAHLACLESETTESNRIVFLGHMCNGLANLCPHINLALLRNENMEKRPSYTQAAIKESENWKILKSKLLETSASAFRLWSVSQINHLKATAESELMTYSMEGLLKILLQWDKIEIQEESDQGNAIHSVLRIPQNISTPVADSLFQFCCHLNAIGGFSINSEVRAWMSRQLLSALLDVYKQKVFSTQSIPPRLLQVQSLQLLFDVQFLMSLMVHNASDDVISQEIINRAVSQIDPFDMDVFSLPLQQNIKKALHKSLSLYGLITSPDQVSYLTSCKILSVSGHMDHNVMLMSPTGARFPHLPLPAKTSSSREQLEEPEVKNTRSSSPNLVAIETPTTLKTTASFYEKVTAMSSSWFGN